ncbi:hypothetical protein X992_5610 [Burkholderia pseudomallei MSHR5492]|nr:hypothetical protein X992_5610 [Burkholderia pseudomallei MSHR5492]
MMGWHERRAAARSACAAHRTLSSRKKTRRACLTACAPRPLRRPCRRYYIFTSSRNVFLPPL